MWYDKYFHWYQRKNVFDVYLDKKGDCDHIYLVVVLNNGDEGYKWLFQGGSNIILKQALQETYKDAIIRPICKNDYKKYLLPTIGTVRSDPRLVSEIEKGYVPGFKL